MNKVRGMMAAGAAVAALVLVFAGASKVAEAIEHTDGYKVGKVAAFAEICGYISQANQIRTRYSFLPDSDEGYKYWRQYLGKYDAVRSPCGVVKNITDDLLSKSFSESTSATGSGDTAVSVPAEERKKVSSATNVPRLVGTWSGYGPLHSSSSRTKCGTARIEMRVFDNAVKGKLRLVSASWLDQASDYPFSGSIDPNGRIRIKGVGLSMTGNVSADGQIMRGEWNASDVACKGTFEATKKW